jgi:DNA primase
MLKIKRADLREQHLRTLSTVTGIDPEEVRATLRAATRRGQEAAPLPSQRSTVDSPQTTVEREALKLALQEPVLAGPMFDAVDAAAYTQPEHVAVRTAIAEAGGAAAATAGAVWLDKVREQCRDLTAAALVNELAVEPLRLDGDPDPRYVDLMLAQVQLPAVFRRVADLKAKLQRLNPVTAKDEYLALAGELFSLEQHARALRDRVAGGV